MWILSVLLLILILGVIIFIHELGHFLWAKKFGVFIHEFSLGMGPILYTKKGKDGINYNLRAVPIGGFVAMAGEVYEDDEENKIPKDKFMCNKKWYQRILILVFGVVNNFISAFLLLFVISLIWGGAIRTTTLESVVEDFPVAEAGIVAGDKILSINGINTRTWDSAEIVLFMEDKDGIYEFEIEKENGDVKTYDIEPKLVEEDGVESRVFGLSIVVEGKEGIISSLDYAVDKFASIIESMILTLRGLFTGKIGVNALSGPIGMYEIVEVSASRGLADTLYLVAFLSINVGFLNILPFPAFDGGRILFLLIEKIKGSPVDSKIENVFHLVGFALLMLLTIYVAVQDIIKIF